MVWTDSNRDPAMHTHTRLIWWIYKQASTTRSDLEGINARNSYVHRIREGKKGEEAAHIGDGLHSGRPERSAGEKRWGWMAVAALKMSCPCARVCVVWSSIYHQRARESHGWIYGLLHTASGFFALCFICSCSSHACVDPQKISYGLEKLATIIVG